MSRAMYTGSIDVHPLLMEGRVNPSHRRTKQQPSSRPVRVQSRLHACNGRPSRATSSARQLAIARSGAHQRIAQPPSSQQFRAQQHPPAVQHAPPHRATSALASENTGSDTTVGDPDPPPGEAAEEHRKSPIRSTTRNETPSSACTRKTDEISTNGFSSSNWSETIFRRLEAAAALGGGGGGGGGQCFRVRLSVVARIQLAVGPQPLWLRNHNSGLAHRIMVKRLATSPHDPLDKLCEIQNPANDITSLGFNASESSAGETSNQSYLVYEKLKKMRFVKASMTHDTCESVRDTASRGPTTIVTPKSQFRTCPSDHDSIGYPRMRASGESSTTKDRFLHASGPHPIPPPNDPKTNQYNQDLGLIHSTNGNHLESPNEGSSIDHQVTIHLQAQNITMFPTNETWYFTSQMLVSSSGGLILILTAQSTRNEFRMHSDY
ncbi:hypothetical protein F511_21224 [Dorcoceras hygrometricum]|uniref:Uncharacterized protein n=1 Tax=Dorcoceras hygrometricum TaxID=472368 RepID=A0A2Z7BF71_9LAMI|nr:hypothetical protein F511_21224 [Dorcoceras hygrometricum]